MFTNREGFNIDAVCTTLSHVVNHRTAVPVALSLSLEPILARWAPALLQTLLHNDTAARLLRLAASHPSLRRPAWAVGLLTSAYALSRWLSHKSTNNWVEDATWDFDREIVLITGGSSGIGAAVAQEFLRRNKRTAVVVVDVGPLKWEVPAGSAGRLRFYECDLTDAEAVAAMADKVRAEVGHPTVLFNNAGVARGAPVLLAAPADLELVIKTNLLAQYYVTQQFLGDMVRRDHGHIVYSGSLSSVIAGPSIGPYSSTKAGLSALHDALQLELKFMYDAPRVRQTLGIFGFIRTPMVGAAAKGGSFAVPFLEVETVAEAIVDSVYSTYSHTIYKPGAAAFSASLRGAPAWMLTNFRFGFGVGLAKLRMPAFEEQIRKITQR
ncbi:NAD(P)-binding domain protein [Cordyceps fumosorosea ARSEF 2679]|uniref:NAD(P)-binding domain protein n=1 Tax=Cordyceps fumosorosea (strain ARSEF 2679) TaxID=1081104 RepID=A0A167SWH9_CORFA|nr:NAD(P)-binding domain protein [Cordyceps fumosorosea ARSEF 2679]OAA60000.1 NAD(P)-binding domain protein [Cordyceps fumosorosea ARSEF 2679]